MKETNFKQTEIGMIPEDWEVKALGEISDPVRGGSPRPAGSPLYFNGAFIPWLTVASITNISDSELFVDKTESFLTELGSHFSRIVEKGSIIISNSGATLGVAKILNIRSCANDGIAILNNLSNNYNSILIVYLINHNTEFLRSSIATGNGQPNLNTERIGNLKFAFPPTIEEQHRIATTLQDTDNLISALDKLIAKKQAIKQGAMQQLLTGKKRLKGFSGEWRTLRLGDEADIRTGKRNGDENIENGLYPFFVRSESVYKINSYSFDGEAILVPGEGRIGEIFHYINGKFDYHQRVYKISNLPDDIDTKFVYFYMKQFFGKYALQNTVKATVDSLRLPTFQNFEMFIPADIKEQRTIAEILSNMDAEIEVLQQKRDKYAAIKEGMMQQLLTGKIRLID